MNWLPHPFPFINGTYAIKDNLSFVVMSMDGGKTWETSWQDQINGGSASNTSEGPFQSVEEGQANCERIAKELEHKQ